MKLNKNIEEQVGNIQLPKYIYTSKFNFDSLIKVKDFIAYSEDTKFSKSEQNKFAQLAAEKLNEYADSIKQEKPQIYYIYAPIRLFRKFLFHSGTYNLFDKTFAELNFIEAVFKLLMSLLYLFIVIGGILGILILFFKNFTINLKLLFPVLSLYFILIFPFAFRVCQYRLFVLAYPFMLVCALYSYVSAYDLILNLKKYLIYK